MNRPMSPGDVAKARGHFAKTAVEQLISWINDQLPKKYIGKEVYINETRAPECYTFRKINITVAIREQVKKSFQHVGWKVRYENAQWFFNAPKNIEKPDLI